MSIPMLILVVPGLALFFVARLAAAWHSRSNNPFGFWQGAALLAAALVIAGAMLRIAFQLWPLPYRPFLPLAAAAAFAPAAVQFGVLLSRAAADAGAESLFGLRMGRRPGTDFSRARTMADRNDVDGAVAQFRRYFDEDGADPAPLFAAAHVLQQYGRFAEAADILRVVLKHFQHDDAAWTRGAFELASLFRNHLGEPLTARHLYHQIIRRQPRSELGRLAHGHLAGTWEKPADGQPPV